MFFQRTSTQYVSFEWKYDSDGKVWANVQAHDTLVAKTPYLVIVNEFGQITQALADNTVFGIVGCPYAAAAAADELFVQIGGYITSMVTASLSVSVGHGMDVYDGAVADNGADYSGEDGEFAVCTTASTTSTTQNAILVPRYIWTTT